MNKLTADFRFQAVKLMRNRLLIADKLINMFVDSLFTLKNEIKN